MKGRIMPMLGQWFNAIFRPISPLTWITANMTEDVPSLLSKEAVFIVENVVYFIMNDFHGISVTYSAAFICS